MIEIKNLTKIYKNKNKTNTKALNDVSFSLPDSGFVFILGKSGSGKSTLINLLGDLDSKTSGDILVDGESLYSLNNEKRREYKASYCGFIFQDYRLINELTVKENILISLKIINDIYNKDNKLKEVLSKVDLDGYEDKMVNELSGGEKQRVAIARALIKNPRIILCDEPTGNLDKNTSTKILDILKEISKTCLIFMVSHDESASLKYASRRIILEEGKIIKDEIRNANYKNECSVENGTLFLPFEKNLSDEEKEKIKQDLKNNNIKRIEQLDNGFKDNHTTYKSENFEKTLQNSTKIEKNLKNRLLGRYFKKGIFSSILNSILFSLLTILLILVQTFISFDSSKIVLDNIDLNNQKNIVITKTKMLEEVNKKTIISFSNEEKEELFGKDIKYYPYINYSSSLKKEFYGSISIDGVLPGSKEYLYESSLYVVKVLGTAIVDKEYLSNTFNDGEEIEVLAGDIDDKEHKTGVILTDYLVDAYNDYYKTSLEYKDFIGQFSPTYDTQRKSFYCIAVIKTDYKEKYKDLYDEYIKIKNNGYLYNEVLDFTQKKDYEDYVNQIVNGELGAAYTLNQNFLSDIEENDEYCNILLLSNLFLSLDETTIIEQLSYENFLYALPNNDLNDNEIIIGKEFANKLIFVFNTSDIIGKDLYITKTISNYYLNQKEDSIKLKIVGIGDNTLVNTATKNKINSLHRKEIARIIPLKNINKAAISKIIKNDVITMDSNSSAYGFVNQVITLYHNIFLLVKFILLSMITIYHVVYSLKSIKDKHYQIGVFKSLGMNNSTISFIFVGKTIIVAIATLLNVSLIAYPFLTLSNHLLISSYTSVFEYSFKNLNVFYFHPIIFIYYYLFNLLLFFAISFIPVFVLRKIEPAKIVNDAND